MSATRKFRRRSRSRSQPRLPPAEAARAAPAGARRWTSLPRLLRKASAADRPLSRDRSSLSRGIVARLDDGSTDAVGGPGFVLDRLAQLAHHRVAGRAQLAHQPRRRLDYFGHPLRAQNDQGHGQDQQYFERVQSWMATAGSAIYVTKRDGASPVRSSLLEIVESTMLKTALVTTRDYARHFAGRSHPERPDRIRAMIDMADSINRPGLQHRAPRQATLAEISLCHLPEYIEMMERTSGMERFDFDPDTHTSPDSYRTALLAAGGVITAVEAVMDGEADNGFAMVRPPGHHALADRAMGFCFFNNVSIAAAWLIRNRGLKRVMIVDWDVQDRQSVV